MAEKHTLSGIRSDVFILSVGFDNPIKDSLCLTVDIALFMAPWRPHLGIENDTPLPAWAIKYNGSGR